MPRALEVFPVVIDAMKILNLGFQFPLQWDPKGGIKPFTLDLHVVGTPSFEQGLDLHFSSPAEVKSNSEF